MIIFLLLLIVAILLFGPYAVLVAGGTAIVIVVIGTVLGIFGWQAILWTLGAVLLGATFVFGRAYLNVRRESRWRVEHHQNEEANALTRAMSTENDRQELIKREIECDRQRALAAATAKRR